MPLVEPLERRAEVDFRPVLVVRLLDLRQDSLEVRARRVHEGVPQQAREGPQVAQIEVLSMNRQAERAEMVDERQDRGASFRVDFRVRREGRAARIEALFGPVNTDSRRWRHNLVPP